MTYNLQWLADKFDAGDAINYIFFWGHSNKSNEEIGKFIFSQWFHSPFKVDNVEYKTSEHWMMAHKAKLFGDSKAFDRIVATDKPGEVKEIGRQIKNFDEIKWNDEKFDIVKKGNIHKFNQNQKLRNYLLATGDHIIVEASPTDTIWGIGVAQDSKMADNPYTWRGLNLLGFALMEARDFLRQFGEFSYMKGTMEPPWKNFPAVDPVDMFWRMGKGEQYLIDFTNYFNGLSERGKVIYELSYPATGEWTHYYREK